MLTLSNPDQAMGMLPFPETVPEGAISGDMMQFLRYDRGGPHYVSCAQE